LTDPVNDQELYHQLREIYQHAYARDRWVAPHADVAFEITEQIGQGGMGKVMRVRDLRLGRLAALKMLTTTDPSSIQRFKREAKITARLDHPSIPPVYEAGRTVNGTHYLLMKLVQGETLKSRIERYHENHREESELKELLQIMIRAGEAVAFANEQGVLHRDLKPSNIMVGRFGEVLVMDWGIARDFSEDEDPKILRGWMFNFSSDELSAHGLTKTGEIVGTPGFMSPEQAAGDVIDERSDVFSLGAMLFHLLADESPLDGETYVERAVALQMGRMKDLGELRPDVPVVLQAIVTAALRRDPKLRTASALRFVASLKEFLHEEEVFEHNYSVHDRVKKRARAHPVGLLIVSSALFFAAVLAFVLAEYQRSRYEEAEVKGVAAARRIRNLSAKLGASTHQLVESRGRLARLKEGRSLALVNASELFKQAQDIVTGDGDQSLLKDVLARAIERGKFSESSYLRAASIYDRCHSLKSMKQVLLGGLSRHPESFGILFCLHDLESRFDPMKMDKNSSYLSKLLDAIAASNVVNGYSLLAQGCQAKLSGALAHSITIYNSAVIKNESLALIYYYRAGAFFAQQKYHATIDDLNKALELNDHLELALCLRGLAYAKLKRSVEALSDLDRALSISPTNAYLYVKRGQLRRSNKDVEGSLIDHERAVKLAPKYPVAWYQLGLTRLALQDEQGGLSAFSKSLGLRSSAEVFASRGRVYEELKMTDTALKDYIQATRLGIKDADVYARRGLIYKKKKQLEKALASFNLAIAFNAKIGKYYHDRGSIYSDLGRFDAAEKDLTQALKMGYKESAVYILRATVFINKGSFKAAESDYDLVLANDPGYVLVYYCRALVRKAQKNWRGCKDDYSRMLELDPSRFKLYYERAQMWRLLKQPAEALKDLNYFVENSGDEKLKTKALKEIEELK
jgi:serine/threonine protein kinase/tetratricopeptide (TPR) repeat protein